MRRLAASLSRIVKFVRANILPLEILYLLLFVYLAYLKKSVPWVEMLAFAPAIYIFRREWYRRRQRELRAEGGCCLKCGYDLHGNTSGVCPECGTPVSNPFSWREQWSRAARIRQR